MSKIPFRVSDGLDGADIRAINIGYPDRNNPSDAVNVQFFKDENTIQQYDPNRKYRTGFAVVYNDRIYYALRDVPTNGTAIAGPFEPLHWRQIRVDPNWINVSTTPSNGYQLVVGSYISSDSTYSDLEYVLPRGAQSGDTIIIKDVSGYLATKKLIVSTPDKVINEVGLTEYQLTLPKATMVFSYDPSLDANKGGWRLSIQAPNDNSIIISPTSKGTQISNGDKVFRRSSSGPIKMILPLYANHGDYITTYDADQMTSVNNLTVETHPNSSSSIREVGTKSIVSKTTGWGNLIYNKQTDVWMIWDGDDAERWISVNATEPAASVNLISKNRILVSGSSGSINFTLPKSPAVGDIVVISFRNCSKGIKVNLKTSTGAERIFATDKMMGIPRLNEIPAYDAITPVAELNHVTTGYGETFKLIFNRVGSIDGWSISEQSFAPSMASAVASVRDRVGLVAFATEAEVLKNSEQTPSDELAVTPLTLSKKTALETRRGIAYLASQNETNAGTDDSKIVTPKKLHERTALEDRRGIAEIATQQETDAGTDDSRIVTPKKLAGRKATEDLTGVASLVKVDGKKQPTRTEKGDGINDFTEHTRIVTPKTLAEKTATETNLGMMFWATQQEVNEGASDNIAVRPSTLQARTATPTRTGLARMVDMTQSEHLKSVTDSLDSNVFITPKALASRIAGSEMDGITRPAYAQDIAAGTHEIKYVSPARLKYFADEFVKVTTPDADGLNVTGTLWKGLVFKVDASTESKRGTIRLATQAETDAGTLDNVVVTPLKLQNKKATSKVYGITRLATAAEAAQAARDDVAITPLTMGSALATSSEWGATEVRRGSTFIGALTNDNAGTTVWQGTDEKGSTRAIDNYQHDFYSVSPRGLNTALQHYLPIKAKAVDSTLFNGLNSTQVMRTDQDTETTGTLTVDKNVKANYIGVHGPVTETIQGGYLSFNKDRVNGATDIVNNSTTLAGGFAFWQGKNDTDMKRVVTISATGRISAEGINTTSSASVGGALTVTGEINYRSQTLDDRFVNVAGDTMTGNLNFSADRSIEFAKNTNITGVPRLFVKGGLTTDTNTGHVAVGATSSTSGFIELGTVGSGQEQIYARRRSPTGIHDTFVLLDTNGQSSAPKSFSAEKFIARSTAEGMISWGNKNAKVNNDGDVYGSIWDNQYLSAFIKNMVDQKVDRKGDTITGDLTLKKDIIVEGSLKIKVGNKYLVIRPNAANETVSFDWENV